MSIRLLLVDDNILFRKGLTALLSQQSDLTVVDALGSGKEATQVASNLEPDVVIMDIRLAGSSGLDIAAQIKRRQPQVKVLMLTSSRNEEYVRAALRLGIDGYILKDASLEELLLAIRSVARGKKYLSPDVSGHVVESFLHPEQSSGKASQLDILTNRERGILQLIAEGRTNRSAAEFLCVSPKTVEKHRASLMQKLGLRNVTEMTLVAMEMGLIERPSSFSRLMGSSNLDTA
ncbi:MAG TPA: response regulator transcription factor [Burkholderiaceae bacterium]|jgi:DNA-binding NarL/FixJ family response regulator|nr:response regulator transcription factor [Burkholderiaceae bacterium]HPH12822.1 response regulator transcription factor [Burkholderiaceae bacterium]